MLDLLFEEHLYLLGVDTKFLEDEVGDVASLVHQCLQQMYRLYRLLS